MKLLLSAIVLMNVALAEDIIVYQKEKAFHIGEENSASITTINAKVGDTLYFMNKEKDVTHNVYSLTPGNEFEIKVQPPQNKKDEGKLTLEKGKFKKGTMEVECAIHPNMKLKVNITE